MPRSNPLATVLATALLAATAAPQARAAAPGRTAPDRPAPPTAVAAGMVKLPAGTHRPLYGRTGEAPRRVAAFHLDRDAVTRGEFLAFVRAHPQWQRGAVKPALAAREGYLADWQGDLDAGDAAALRRAVTGVSRHAARAYCAAQGKRLPTVAEWEYAAAASATARDATRDPAFRQQLLARYASRAGRDAATGGRPNAFGVRGLHDRWEWTASPADAHADHADHAEHADGQHDLSCAGAALGAVDPTDYPAFLRYAMRAGLTDRTTLTSLGFRCAR